jgi:hypothetical protein
VPDVRGAAFESDDPRADNPRWVVSDVLRVATLEVGDPIVIFVLMERDDFAWGHLTKQQW